jgi:alpha-L-fucosidase
LSPTIIRNRSQEKPKPGEDVQTFERDLSGDNTAGFNTKYVSNQLPLESCDTINDSWGFNITDSKYKTPAELVRRLVQTAGNNSHLLLNIGPMPNGEIQQEFAVRLRAVGDWLAKYGDSIYGTRGGPVAPADWGVTTQKGNKVLRACAQLAGTVAGVASDPGQGRDCSFHDRFFSG